MKKFSLWVIVCKINFIQFELTIYIKPITHLSVKNVKGSEYFVKSPYFGFNQDTSEESMSCKWVEIRSAK